MLAFEAIAREFSAPLRRHLEHQVGNSATAADLLQETLLRASRKLDSFEGRASLKTWLYAIAGNVVADYLRQPVHQQQMVAIMEAVGEAVA